MTRMQPNAAARTSARAVTPRQPVLVRARRLLERLLQDYHGHTQVRLWDGTIVTPDTGEAAVLIFRDPAPIRDLFLYGDVVRLGEAYLAGHVDVEGDMESVYDLVDYLQQRSLTWRDKFGFGINALRLPSEPALRDARAASAGRSGLDNSRDSIAYHYDVSNAFYQLWLDPQMVYSCAYFRDGTRTLAQAQEDKLEHICRKLRLQPGQTLLDIGCGWGAMLIHAAERYGVHCHGVTLSEQQHSLAMQRVRERGLEERVKIELLDYRNLPEEARYDRVVSVGMFEHVGIRQLPVYFGTVKRVLKPDGLFLNHGITNDHGVQSTPVTRFCKQYVFPDGELTRVSDVETAMEEAGFEIWDVEGLRHHYAMTLRHWIHNLEQHHAAAVRETGEMTYRVWRLYMAAAAYFFANGGLGLYQILAGHRYENPPVPLTRSDLYV